MTTLPMTDPWIEALYKIEFNANPTEFLEKIKKLFVEIAKYLGISSSTVSKILLEDRSESGNS